MPNLAGHSHRAHSPSPFTPTPPPSANTWAAKPASTSPGTCGVGTLITPPTSAPIPAPAAISTPTPTLANTDDRSFWQTALSEAGHFAGGLLPHPTESTKHYTILRHSAALVFYRGPSTSVEISIFSAPKYPLPPDRTLWLQQRGYSGDSGMKLKAMVGATDHWLNVTPAAQVRAGDVPANDNRAWQRDISKAARNLIKDRGEVKAHVPRETHVIRIPSMSSDGYFRLALCTGGGGRDDATSHSRRKVLCLSPIFRVASTSTDSSVFRGASLSTMPIEVGVKVASIAAHVAVKRYTGPVVGLVQSRIDKIRPGLAVREISKSALTSLTPKSSPNGPHTTPATTTFSHSNALLPLGHPSGPDPPFPLQFSGTVVPGSGRSQLDLGIPTANLTSLSPSDTPSRLRGVYFGWACLTPPRHPQTTWHQAVVASGPSPYARPSVIQTPCVSVHLLHEFPAPGFIGAQVTVVVMGFLRPMLGEGGEAGTVPLRVRLDAVSRDVLLTVASLTNREGWTAERGVEGVARRKGERGVRERVTGEVQRRVEGVPVHFLGVRTEAEAERERGGERGKGGWWVAW